jgi:hypothetical protein
MSNNSRGELWGTFPPQHSPSAETIAAAACQQSFDEKELSRPQLQCPVYCLINEYYIQVASHFNTQVRKVLFTHIFKTSILS